MIHVLCIKFMMKLKKKMEEVFLRIEMKKTNTCEKT